jgi:hypothetical protein
MHPTTISTRLFTFMTLGIFQSRADPLDELLRGELR